jgi:creatinine amidohydrolase
MQDARIQWGENSWEQIGALAEAGAVVVAPFGSTEQHGPALPVDTDIRIAEKVAGEGAELAADAHGVPVVVLPTMPFGLAGHHMAFPGTVTLQPETYVTVVAEILSCAVTHGFRKIAVISGHGGNRPGLELAIKKLIWDSDERLRVALFKGWSDAEFAKRRQEAFAGLPSEGQIAIHASRPEVSGTLADRPELVRQVRREKPTLKVDRVPEWAWLTHELSETGAFGDPTLGDAELGEKLWRAWAEAFALFIRRLWEEE